MAFRLPPGHEHEIFAAWKGVIYYGFEHQRATPLMNEMMTWLKEIKIPLAAITGTERDEFKVAMEKAKTRLFDEWRAVERVLQDYQLAYDKMFKLRTGSTDFVNFLQNSSKAYWILGTGLGKTCHASYCWNAMAKRHPNRKLPWEQTREFITLLTKIFPSDRKG